MQTTDVIAAKRDGHELSADEISFFIRGVTDGSIPDYQASAWLMAVTLNGMTARETRDLTLAMRDSGRRVDLTEVATQFGCAALDKHSTGGVGDKTTLVVVPILAACGVPMLKMSGRGLGFSGGTVDKLESIPGFRTEMSVEEAKGQVRRIGAALIAQSYDLAPADKILYELRDVTSTVESIPLIASSIMSKKLAAGGQRIVLDVKVGRGSFMQTRERAEQLARTLVEIGNGAGVPTSALLTAMDEPLGTTVGNALEVREALHMLRSVREVDPRFRALCVEIAARGLLAVGKSANAEAARAEVDRLLVSGAALAKFEEIVAEQGGPLSADAIELALPYATVIHVVAAHADGIVASLDAARIGHMVMQLGAGREAKTDRIDPAIGVELHAKVGSAVSSGQPLATLHLKAEHAARTETLGERLRAAYTLAGNADVLPAQEDLILTTIS